MSKHLVNRKTNFGSFEVFVTSISTILGAILFLKFGWAVGNLGFISVVGIIVIGHLVTIPTAFAVAEIATNQKVLGGGAYYIISRSFGLNIGATVGISLYLSQAVSIAFYIIAFAEASQPILEYFNQNYGIPIFDKRLISLPVMAIISVIVIYRGANMGMKALYIVAAILGVSLVMFFAGNVETLPVKNAFYTGIQNPSNLFFVFTIIFPAFTGLAAGLGLSGDLKDPKTAIPRGTLLATFVGLVVYIAVAYKLAISFTPTELADPANSLIMQRVAKWGPIIPIGLAAASLSSALGSILVVPRTLQAIGADDVLPNRFISKIFAKGKPVSNEPVNANIISIIIAFIFISIGTLEFVAQIISMFFMVTYGAICLVSLLENFAADPSYRPTFRSRWYISLIGTILSFWLMFKMNSPYAVTSLIIMGMIYYAITVNKKEKRGFEKLFRGVIFQLSRWLQILAQRADKEDVDTNWRPFVICISQDTFKRRSAYDLLRWIAYKYGFGTYIHYIEGYLSKKTERESKVVLERLINLASGNRSRVYLDTLISPSYTSAIAQVVQLSGISGKGNNTILFEFSRTDPDTFKRSLENYSLIYAAGFDVCVLNTSYKGFGDRRVINIWITSYDYENANLMILLAYIILGHPDWNKGHIKIFTILKESELNERKEKLMALIKSGRLPISPGNIRLIPSDDKRITKDLIAEKSVDADLTIVGFRHELVKAKGIDVFTGFGDIGNILFVSSQKEKEIT
ncbi:MAG: amino acid permease [Bacteroidales bacterium]|nr:amino acid permease [Bacteroidales bacterium]